MDKLLHFLKGPVPMFVIGGLATLAIDHRTGGKVSSAVAQVPVLGKLVLG
jgi:hypothetical protein